MLKFKVGDVCITQNTAWPVLNDGLTVKVIAIDPTHTDQAGISKPYVIRRVDGKALPVISDARGKNFRWFVCTQATCAESRLRIPRSWELDAHSVVTRYTEIPGGLQPDSRDVEVQL